MPWNLASKTISRVWQFVDQFTAAEKIERTHLDTAFDDVKAGVNDAIEYLIGQIEAAASSELYLGVKSSPPALNNAGAALVEGNFYIKSPEYEPYVYNSGGSWERADQFGTASAYFRGLAGAADAETLRGLLELGTAATFASSSFATPDDIAAETGRITNALNPVTMAGTGDNLSIISTVPITEYAAGQAWLLRADRAPTGAVTLNVDGVGAKDVKKLDATNALADIATDDWAIGDLVPMFYDGTRFIVPRYGVLPVKATEAKAQAGTDDRDYMTPLRTVDAINAQVAWTNVAAVSTTSGTAFDVTDIPDEVEEIEVFLIGVSLSGTDRLLVQIGTGASPATSGYDAAFTNFTGSVNSTSGILITGGTAGEAYSGVVKLHRVAGTNQWMADGQTKTDGGTGLQICAGTVTLGGALNIVRLTRTGTDTFDAGSFALRYKTV